MIRCLAIDDEPLALKQLVTYIEKVPFLELAGKASSAVEAKMFLQNDTCDVMFCDINMPDLNGMDFVKSLASPPLVVFTTAYADYAVEGFRVNAVDYLLKPFGLDEFKRAAERVRERSLPPTPSQGGGGLPGFPSQGGGQGEARGSSLYVKTDYRVVRIDVSKIRYVEAMSEYLRIHLEDEPKPIITLLSMKKIEEWLPDNFMRIHRSYIVNLEKVQEVNKNRIILDADTYLPIGDMYREAFQRYLDERFLGR
jgi:DNA-binding LytR/AlgR family response regulator